MAEHASGTVFFIRSHRKRRSAGATGNTAYGRRRRSRVEIEWKNKNVKIKFNQTKYTHTGPGKKMQKRYRPFVRIRRVDGRREKWIVTAVRRTRVVGSPDTVVRLCDVFRRVGKAERRCGQRDETAGRTVRRAHAHRYHFADVITRRRTTDDDFADVMIL